jgi:triosephosphate isomerase (TIM)
MKKRIPIIAGNWKMFNTISESLNLVKALHYGLAVRDVEVVVAPSFTALNKVAEFLKDSFIKVSGQNFFWEEQGAYTGEVSAKMLKEAGASYVIIGHSERRQYFGETDATVNKKTKAALKHGLMPIVCVGETLSEREQGQVEEIISRQVEVALAEISNEEALQIVIAYEPVWAIGTGKTATTEQVVEVHSLIRSLLMQRFGDYALKMRILYGGSVKASNSRELLAQDNVDGALVGGASLKAEEFMEIVKSAG